MFDSDLKPTTGSGLVSEYEMFENELFKSDPGSKEGAKVSLYDNIPGLGEESVLDENAAGSNNSHVVREIQSGTSAEREAAQMSLQEQRQLLARLESQHVDPNMRGVINQLKVRLHNGFYCS